ncbi:Potassium Voltage-Gated Channel Subfamily A Member 6 [Manis pentadactyla]|nr:Potassium Voltage-Gated Channel Subfamily A Member 6 [Manis pentadactyla]
MLSRITEPGGLLPAQRDKEQREEDESQAARRNETQGSSLKGGGDFASAIGSNCPLKRRVWSLGTKGPALGVGSPTVLTPPVILTMYCEVSGPNFSGFQQILACL